MLSSALLGSEEPRLWTKPLRELTPETSLGFECIRFAEEVLGISLMPWQKWVLIHALELREDGTFRFRTWVLLVARQSGKTTLVMVLALWRMYVDQAGLVIGTAQNLDVAEEAWTGAIEMAEGVPELRDLIKHIDRTNGKKSLRLETGERYKIAAASRRGGRGLSGDLVMLDELREHQTWDAWAAVTKTTMARARPQVVCTSNAGDEKSIVLHHLRKAALKFVETGDGDDSLGIFEYSAPDDCSIDDRDGWAQASPALGHTMTEQAIASAAATDPEHVFRTEMLCQWVGQMKAPEIDPVKWAACADDESQIIGTPSLAVEVSPRRWAAVAVAGKNAQDRMHVEAPYFRTGTEWVPVIVKGLCDAHGIQKVHLRSSSEAASLVPALEAAGVVVEVMSAGDFAAACGSFLDMVNTEQLAHIDDDYTNVTALGIAKKASSDAWKWDARNSVNGGAIVIAATVAAWVASQAPGDVSMNVW